MRGLLKNRRVVVGLCLLAFFLLLAILGPPILSLLHRSPNTIDYSHLSAAPSGTHWLGTTSNGQDVLTEVIYGARGSVFTGLMVAVFITIFATAMGMIGAYLGGVADATMNGVTNVALTIAGFPLLIVISSYVPSVGLVGVAAVIAIVSWPGGARQIRAQTLSVRGREFVEAMRMAGETKRRLIVYEVMPHLLPQISALFIGGLVTGVMAQAGLAFLGLGGTSITWGLMISEIQSNGAISQGEWWWFVPPGLALVLFGMSAVLINFGIDEIANPRLRGLDPKVLKRVIATAKRVSVQSETAAAK